MSKYVVACLVRCVFGVLGIVLLVGCDRKSSDASLPVRPVKAVEVGAKVGFIGRSFPGRAKATQEVDLAFDVSGTLNERPVNVGDEVKKGQLIARLDPRDFEAKLKSTEAEELRDQQNYARGKELVSKDFISRAEFDRLKAKLEVSKSSTALAEKALTDTVIAAPFAGTVADIYVENFQSVRAKQVVARLLDTSQIEMVVQIPESIISLVPQARGIYVTFDAFPDHRIPAKIKEISNEASATTRTFPVNLIMDQPKDITILPGMAGSVSGEGDVSDALGGQQLVLPATAIFTPETEKQSYVWVIDQNTKQVQRRAVKIGELTSTGISVLSGVKAGEWVVTAGVNSLQEGQRISILGESKSKNDKEVADNG